VLQELDGCLKVADLACPLDERQIWELPSMGRIPGRHAPAKRALPLAGFFFEPESHCGDGAESSPLVVVDTVGSFPVVLLFFLLGIFCLFPVIVPGPFFYGRFPCVLVLVILLFVE
jgi:hypothetical protein